MKPLLKLTLSIDQLARGAHVVLLVVGRGATPLRNPNCPDCCVRRTDSNCCRCCASGDSSPRPDSTVEFAGGPADAQLDRASAVAHIDPRHPWATATLAGARMGMHVSDCSLSTEAEPPYLRLPSVPELNPYLIAYLFGFPSGETRNVLVDMQVFSAGGSVRLTATGNPTGVTVGFTSFPIAVPISLTTTADGFASVFVQRNGQTGFDWHSFDVF